MAPPTSPGGIVELGGVDAACRRGTARAVAVCSPSPKLATCTNACRCSGRDFVAAGVERGDREVVRFEAADRQVLGLQIAEREVLDGAEAAVAEDVQLDGLLRRRRRPRRRLPRSSRARDWRSRWPAPGRRGCWWAWPTGRCGRAASRSRRRLSVNSCTTSGSSSNAMIMADMSDSSWSTSSADALLGGVEPRAAVGVGRRHAGRAVDEKDELLALRATRPASPAAAGRGWRGRPAAVAGTAAGCGAASATGC